MSLPSPSSGLADADRHGLLRAVLFAFFLVIAVAVTLPGQEFSNGGENLLLTTATETRRTGNWLIPTMNGQPRVNKPPFPMWLSAILIDDDTMAGLDNPDPAVRHAAIGRLNWQLRWPALAAGGLAILVAFELGRTLSGRTGGVGWIAAAALASQILFLRSARSATTDIQLMLWVGVANLLIAKALLDGWRWLGPIGAGAAVGLAMMSKGPVALVQTIAPVLVFMGLVWWRRWGLANDPLKRPAGVGWAAVLLGCVAALLVGVPWYLLIYLKTDGQVIHWWIVEVTREGATELPPGEWYSYLIFLPLLAPWTVFFVVGLVAAVREWWPPRRDRAAVTGGFPVVVPGRDEPTAVAVAERLEDDDARERRGRGMVLAVLMVVVPLLIMSFFRDRKDRYTLPMTIPAAVVIGRGVIEYLKARAEGQKVAWLSVVHWSVVGVMAIGVVVAGATKLKTADGTTWYTAGEAAAGVAVAVVLLGAGVWLDRRRSGRGLVAVTFVLLMALQVMFLYGYRDSSEGRSEMRPLAEEIWQTHPGAAVRATGKRRIAIPPDLPLYLNRPVPWVDSPAELEPAEHAWVVVMRQRRGEETPEAPPGWIALTPVWRDSNRWHAFVLPGR